MIDIICISPVRLPINFNSDFLNLSGDYLRDYRKKIAAAIDGIEIHSTYDANPGTLHYDTLDEDAADGRLQPILEFTIRAMADIKPDIDRHVELSDLKISIFDNTISLVSYKMRCEQSIIVSNEYQKISNVISIYLYNYIWKNIIWKIYDIYQRLNKERGISYQIDDDHKTVFRDHDQYIVFHDMNILSREEPYKRGVLWTTRCILSTDNTRIKDTDASPFPIYGDVGCHISEGVIHIMSDNRASYAGIINTIMIFQYYSAVFEVIYSNSRAYYARSLYKSATSTIRRQIGDASFFSISVTQFVNNYRAAIYGLQGPRRELGNDLSKSYQMETLIGNMMQQIDNMRARFAALRARQQSRFAFAVELALLVIGAMGLTEVLINLYWFRFSEEFERTSEVLPVLTYFGGIPVDISFGVLFLIIALLAYALLRSRK